MSSIVTFAKCLVFSTLKSAIILGAITAVMGVVVVLGLAYKSTGDDSHLGATPQIQEFTKYVGLEQPTYFSIVWVAAAIGAYVGALIGIGRGLKVYFRVQDAPKKNEVPDVRHEAILGGADAVIPGVGAIIGLGKFIHAASNVDLPPDPRRSTYIFLEGVAWSIVALGLVAAAYVLTGNTNYLYGLLFVPLVAVFGGFCGAENLAHADKSKEGHLH